MTTDLRRLVKKIWRCSKYPSLYTRQRNYKKNGMSMQCGCTTCTTHPTRYNILTATPLFLLVVLVLRPQPRIKRRIAIVAQESSHNSRLLSSCREELSRGSCQSKSSSVYVEWQCRVSSSQSYRVVVSGLSQRLSIVSWFVIMFRCYYSYKL